MEWHAAQKVTSLPVDLVVLDFSRSWRLAALPDGISGLTALQTLGLGGCGSLAALPDGISGLAALQSLKLEWCASLAALPEGISRLASLQTLNLTGCPAIVPNGLSDLTSLLITRGNAHPL